MRHPHSKTTPPKAITGKDPDSGRAFTDYRGTPDIFPPVTVNHATQEAEHRAKGYVAHDEPDPAEGDYQEFPKWLQHETHEPVLVNTAEQQAEALERGYFEPGQSDAQAVEAAHAAPYVPGRIAQPYPRMEDGVLVQDPDLEPDGPIEYPKALTPPGGGDQVFVKSRAEETATLAKWGQAFTHPVDVKPAAKTIVIQKRGVVVSGVVAVNEPGDLAARKAEANARRSASMKARAAAKKAAKAQATA